MPPSWKTLAKKAQKRKQKSRSKAKQKKKAKALTPAVVAQAVVGLAQPAPAAVALTAAQRREARALILAARREEARERRFQDNLRILELPEEQQEEVRALIKAYGDHRARMARARSRSRSRSGPSPGQRSRSRSRSWTPADQQRYEADKAWWNSPSMSGASRTASQAFSGDEAAAEDRARKARRVLDEDGLFPVHGPEVPPGFVRQVHAPAGLIRYGSEIPTQMDDEDL